MPGKTVLIHIGFAKTGTTSIQKFLASNRGTLRERGILYPRVGTLGADPHHQLACSLGLADPGRDVSPLGPKNGFLEAWVRELESFAGHTCIISSEVLSTYAFQGEPDILRRALQDHDCKVVAYLRRQDLWLNSWAVEIAKNGHRLDLGPNSTHPACALADYHRSLQPWAAAFGRDAVVVRPFEKSQFHGKDLITDFMRLAGVELPDARLPEPPRLNEALHPWEAAVMLEFYDALRARWKETGLTQYALQDYHWLCNTAWKPATLERASFLGPEESGQIVARYAESNARVAREFLGRGDGSLFHDPIAGDPANVPSLSDDVKRNVVAFFMEALAQERFLHSQTMSRVAEVSAAAESKRASQADDKVSRKQVQQLKKLWKNHAENLEQWLASNSWKAVRILDPGLKNRKAHLEDSLKKINELLAESEAGSPGE